VNVSIHFWDKNNFEDSNLIFVRDEAFRIRIDFLKLDFCYRIDSKLKLSVCLISLLDGSKLILKM